MRKPNVVLLLMLGCWSWACLPAQQPPAPGKAPCTCQAHAETKPDDTKPAENYWAKTLHPDVLPVWIGGVAAFLASVAGLIALKFLRDQIRVGIIAANAAKDSASAYITSERPFVMIETRGDEGYEFWAVNYGRSPAQIIFSNPTPFVDTFLLEELPDTLNYGLGYENPNARQINVQWIAPGKAYPLGAFDPRIIEAIGEHSTQELIQSIRVMLIYSAFKYRGIHTTDVYMSTYCYRKYPSGLRMWGAEGWNKYT